MAINARGSRTVQELGASKSTIESNRDKDSKVHIEYGTIDTIDLETSRVTLKRANGSDFKTVVKERDSEIRKFYYSLLTPLHEIHMKFGPLRPGLWVRIHWEGEHEPQSTVALEIISDNETLGKQDFAEVEIAMGFSIPL